MIVVFHIGLGKRDATPEKITTAQDCMVYVQDRSAQPSPAIPAEAIIAHSQPRMFYCFELCTAHLSHRIAGPLLTPSSKKAGNAN